MRRYSCKIWMLLIVLLCGFCCEAFAVGVKNVRRRSPLLESKRGGDKQENAEKEQEFKYFFYEAMLTFDADHFDESLALLLHCEDIKPDDAATAYYLGIIYGGLNNEERMFHYFDKAYRLCPREYWYSYAVQHYKVGTDADKKKAVAALKEEIKSQSDNSHAAQVLQQIYINEYKIKDALAMQDVIDRIDGVDMSGAIRRYRLNTMLGRSAQAYNAINNYLKQDPYDYYMQVFLGDALLQQGNAKQAFEQYQKIEQSFPENPYLALSLSNYYGAVGNADKAAEYEMKAIENEQISVDYKLGVLHDYQWLQAIDSMYFLALNSLKQQYPLDENVLKHLVDFYLAKDENESAETLLWTMLDINPENSSTWQSLLSIYQTDTTITPDDYKSFTHKAIKHQPEVQQWYYIMSSLQMMEGSQDSALYYCQEGLKQPDGTDLHYKIALIIQIADIYIVRQEYDSAFDYYEKALQYNPENVYVLNNYAYTLALYGSDLRKAEKMSQRTIKSEPNNPTYLDTYAWILHLQGQTTLARFYMQQAWDNSPEKNDEELVQHYQEIFK